MCKGLYCYYMNIERTAATAQWILLRLPSCGSRFETQAQHLRFFNLLMTCEKDENKQKEAVNGPQKIYMNIEAC